MTTKAAPTAAPAKAESKSSAAPSLREPPAKVHAAPGTASFSTASRLQGGAPLPGGLRARMEYSFGRPFEGVRVHTDGAAAHVAQEHHAEALTVGPHIAFGAGRYRPETPQGQHLVAHEIAHVAQQSASGAPSGAPSSAPSRGRTVAQARSLDSAQGDSAPRDSVPGEPAEVAAEAAAVQAVSGEKVQLGGAGESGEGRVMRRALLRLPPPPNPAPLRGRIAPPTQPPEPTPRAREAIREVATVKPERAATVAAALTPPPQPQPATGQGEMLAQEQTEQARAAAKEAIEEAPAPETGAEVPELAGGGAAKEAAPAEVKEAPSAEAADKKEEAQAEAEGEQAGEEAKSEEAAGEGKKERAPSSPKEDPAFQRVLRHGRAVAKQQAHNNTAKRKAAEAQAAAMGPPNEVEALAGGNQVGKMAEQEPQAFDKESFKAALIAKINQIAPNTIDDADKFKSRGSTGQLKASVAGQVEASKEGAQGPIQQTAQEAPDTGSVEPKQVTPQPPTESGPPPAGIGASAAAPKPKSDAEVNLDAGPQSIDDKLAENKIEESTLANSNEPEFTGAVEAKNEAAEHAQTAPEAYRQDEAAMIQNAQGGAAGIAETETGAMYDTRGQQFESVQGEQDTTKSGDETKRAEIASKIQSIFDDTKTNVEERLAALDEEVNTAFDAGAESARQEFDNEVEREKEAWKDRRYSGIDGAALWLRDLFLPLPDEVNGIYQTARQHYIDAMSVVIDNVAGIVETGLNEATGTIQAGRDSVLSYVESLDGDLRQLGEDAAAGIQAQFDQLADDVNSFEKSLVDNLAQKYVDNLKAVDARIEQMQQDDRGLMGKAMDAIQGVIDTILELKQMLLGILARAGDVIDTIIKDPIGFLGNLVTGIKSGLSAFLGNIAEHLKKGLMGWLFGAVAAAGIELPESFDLKGLLSLGAQILGLTYQNIRARAVRILGEKVVGAMEKAVEIFRILMTQGLGGVWTYIKDMLGNLAETVIGGIRDWVAQKVIIAGITWLLSLLNPASAFVRAVKMIIDVVMFFISRGSQIMSLVTAILDSIAAIASGAIGAMASAVEGALARAVPVAISFLASLLGLGGISDMIRKNIERIQAPVNKAIDWLIQKAVKLLKAVGGFFGFGKKEEEPQEDDTLDPEKQAKVEAGLAAIDQLEQAKLDQGEIEKREAEEVAATVRREHPVFHSLQVVDGEDTWDYAYEASSRKTKTGAKKDDDDGKVSLYLQGKPKGQGAWQSHHVPQKVMARYFGEVYSAAAAALKNSDPAKAARYQGKASDGESKGSGGAGLSSVWLSEDTHAAAHAAQGTGDLNALAAKLRKSASRGHKAGFDSPIFPETQAGNVPSYVRRSQIRRGAESETGATDPVVSEMKPVFARVYAGMFTAGYQGVNAAFNGKWQYAGEMQPKAEATWGSLKNPDA